VVRQPALGTAQKYWSAGLRRCASRWGGEGHRAARRQRRRPRVEVLVPVVTGKGGAGSRPRTCPGGSARHRFRASIGELFGSKSRFDARPIRATERPQNSQAVECTLGVPATTSSQSADPVTTGTAEETRRRASTSARLQPGWATEKS
jgi:hypothetical protein